MGWRRAAICVLFASATACSLLTSLDGLTGERSCASGECIGGDARDDAPVADGATDVASSSDSAPDGADGSVADAADAAVTDAGSDADGSSIDASDADAGPPVTLVQSTLMTVTTATVAPLQQGNLVVVAVISTVSSISGITDDTPGGTNTYGLLNQFFVQSPVDGGGSCGIGQIWYAKNVRGGATTLSFSWGAGTASAWVMEVSGVRTLVAPVHQELNTQVAATLAAAPRVVPPAPRSFVVSLVASCGNTSGIAGGNPFTALSFQAGDNAAYLITTASGSYGASWTNSPDVWGALTAAF